VYFPNIKALGMQSHPEIGQWDEQSLLFDCINTHLDLKAGSSYAVSGPVPPTQSASEAAKFFQGLDDLESDWE
jgi:hypothetical protein